MVGTGTGQRWHYAAQRLRWGAAGIGADPRLTELTEALNSRDREGWDLAALDIHDGEVVVVWRRPV